MADMHFEESCPCGSNIKVSGYESYVKAQVFTWQRTHTRHSHAIAKAVAENKMKPAYYVWPNTELTGVVGAVKQE